MPGDGGGRLSTGLISQEYGSSSGFQPRTMPPQGDLRSLPADRVMQNMPGTSPRMEASSPPVVFTTAAVPQMHTQESAATLSYVEPSNEENMQNEYLQLQVADLERQRQDLQRQLQDSRSAPQSSANTRDIEVLQQRLREAEQSEATALRAHEARLHEINELEQQMNRLRQREQLAMVPSGQETSAASDRYFELQNQLEQARASEAAHRRKVEDQAAQLQENAREIQRSRNFQASMNHDEKLDMERNYASVRREKEEQMRVAEQTQSELLVQSRGMQDMERKMADFKALEDNYQRRLQEDRRTITTLEAQLESESRTKDFHMDKTSANEEYIKNLEGELGYLKGVETHYKKQCDIHQKEAKRLKRLREEDAPPEYIPRMPLKALEERVMNLAIFTMVGVCSLPIMGAIALLADENYVFWMGKQWPHYVVGGCVCVFLAFWVTVQGLFQYARPEHRSQFTMAFTWATFAALLGIVLVPLSLMANKHALATAGTISQGCMTAMPQSEMLVDYGEVLYNIRVSENCTNAKSVTECRGWAANKYTEYLAYLETDFQCGPLCPESPPQQARLIHAPDMHNAIPTRKPTIPPPPRFGPPLQNALGVSAFLQATDGLVGRDVQVHEQKAGLLPPSPGIMETALPHMQARKLFSKGDTRITCYPMIATRLKVLVTTFGGLWYWEGMGLIIISLLTSLYAGMYFAFGMS